MIAILTALAAPLFVLILIGIGPSELAARAARKLRNGAF